MTFLLLLLYIILIYFRPWQFYPELEPLRLAFTVGNFALAAAAIRFVVRGPYLIFKLPETYLFFGFVFMVVVSRVIAMAWLGGAVDAFLEFSAAFTMAVMIFLVVDSPRKLRIAAAAIAGSLMILVAMGAIAHYTQWEEEKFVLLQRTGEFDAAGERVVLKRIHAMGTLDDPNDFGQALLAALPLLWPAWKSRRYFNNFVLVMLPGMFMLYGVFLTRSRGAVLGLMFMVAMHLRERMTRFRTVLPAAVALCAAVVLLAAASGGRDISSDDESAAGRVMAWRAGLTMLLQNPLTGVGYGQFAEHHVRAAHNSYVNCFAELGIFGYLFWLGLLIAMYTTLDSITRMTPSDKDGEDVIRWARAVQFSLHGLLATAFFLSRTYAPPFYIAVGLVIAVRVIASRVFEEPVPPLRLGVLFGQIGRAHV